MAKKILANTRANCKAQVHQTNPAVMIRIGATVHEFQLVELSDQAASGQRITALFASAALAPEIRIPNLLAISDEDRFPLFACLNATGRPFKLACGGAAAALRPSPVDAVLDAFNGQHDLMGCERIFRAAIEVAALFDADYKLAASQKIANRAREAGLKSILPQTVRKAIDAIIGVNIPGNTVTAIAAEFLANERSRMADETNSAPGNEPPLMVHYENAFWIYEGSMWRRCQSNEVTIRVTQHLQRRPGDREVTARLVSDVMANLQALTALPSSRCDLPLWIHEDPAEAPERSPYLAFTNGLIDLEQALQEGIEPELYCHSPRHFSRSVLPFEFDPHATCPLWRQTLGEILSPGPLGRCETPDQRLSVLQEFMGYTLVPGLAYQKCLVLFGSGANGKSVITETWAQLAGRDNVSHVAMAQFGDRFGKAELDGKLLNIAAEMNRLDKVDEGVFKSLVTGDPLQVERKFEPPFTMRPTAKFIFTTNELSPFRDHSDGIWRRLVIMPLLQRFQGDVCDPDRAQRLQLELPGIFLWALEGARRLRQQGGFSQCGVCEAALDAHRYESDVVAQYVAQSPLGATAAVARIPTDQYYADFRTWCGRNGRTPLCSTEFGRRLPRLGIGRGRANVVNPLTGTRGYTYGRVADAARANGCGGGDPHRHD